MKVVLSRKGFDSSYGGFPSIIWPNGQMISFPIPEADPECKGIDAKDLKYIINNACTNLDNIIDKKLNSAKKINIPKYKETKNRKGMNGDSGREKGRAEFHYDPQIQEIYNTDNKKLIQYATFGQSGAAAGHLVNNFISPDGLKNNPALFLFFGLFQETKWEDEKKEKLIPYGKPFHAIWGYLIATGAINISSHIDFNNKKTDEKDIKKINEIIKNYQCLDFLEEKDKDVVTNSINVVTNSIKKHPHFINRYSYGNNSKQNNFKNIVFWGKRFGTFNFNEKTKKYLCLSDIDNSNNLTDWLIPNFITKMTYNNTSITESRKNPKNIIDKKLKIKAASKGQEFVIKECSTENELIDWLRKLKIDVQRVNWLKKRWGIR